MRTYKYIDAEKLLSEIESRMEDCKLPDGTFPTTTNIVRYEELSCLHNFITSLQHEQPVVKGPFDDEQFRRGYEAGKHDAMREQKPKIELIQRAWYMEGYNDREYNKEPKWIISTGPDGPQYKLNPNREGGRD